MSEYLANVQRLCQEYDALLAERDALKAELVGWLEWIINDAGYEPESTLVLNAQASLKKVRP